MSSNPYRPDDDNPYQSSQLSYGIEASGTADLAGVQRGVSLAYVALLLSVLCAVGGGILAGVWVSNPTNTLRMAIIGFQVVAIGASVLEVVSRVFCLSAPPQTNARELIIAAVVCDVIYMVVTLASMIVQVPDVVVYVSAIVSVIGYLCFVVFLKRMAIYIRQPDLAGRAQTVVTLCLAMIVAFVVMIVGLLAQIEAFAIVGLIILVLALWTLVVYARLLASLQEALRVASN